MAAPVGFDGRAGYFRWPIYTTVSMAAPVIFDGRAGRFRWPRRSFSMAAPVGFDGRAGIFDGRAGRFRLDNCVPMKHSNIQLLRYRYQWKNFHKVPALPADVIILPKSWRGGGGVWSPTCHGQ